MKDIIKDGIKLWGKTVVISLLCFFLVISVVSIAVSLSGEDANTVTYGLIIQFLTLVILTSFIYPSLWSKGYKDRNMVQTGNLKPDPLKGLKIGLVSIIPSVLSVPVLALIKGFSAGLFKLLNPIYYCFFDLLTRGTDKFYQLSAWKFPVIITVFLILPLISFLGYYLGFSDISIGEKITYKKTK